MGLDNHIEYAMKGLLKNPILSVLREIKIANILKLIPTDLSLDAKEVIETYKKRWNIEQGYKDLREHFGRK